MFLEGSHVFVKPLAGTVFLQELRRGRDGMSPLGPKKELRAVSYTHLTLPTNREV